nr:MAG TPA: hypothetical protein [Caudoviricetes sp.]
MNNTKESYSDTKVYSLAIAVLDLEDYTKFKKMAYLQGVYRISV